MRIALNGLGGAPRAIRTPDLQIRSHSVCGRQVVVRDRIDASQRHAHQAAYPRSAGSFEGLFVPQSHHWIDSRSPPRWNGAREQRYRGEEQRYRGKRERIQRRDAIEKARDDSRQRYGP